MSTGTQILFGVAIAIVLFAGVSLTRRRKPAERRPVTPELDARLAGLVADGKTIVAIKELRQETGMGLREAKEHVEGLTPPTRRRDDDRIQALLARGEKLQAIKELRERTGMGLAEATEYVDRLPAYHGEPDLTKVRDLAASGKQIHAIKELRAATGMGLREAKEYVDALVATGEPPAPPRLSEETMARARELAAAGKVVQAVKAVRDETGWSLKRAKDFVDGLR